MAIGLKKTKRFLDPETCFRLWMKTNSIKDTTDELIRTGLVNPKTGKPPTQMGVWNSAWLFVMDNMVEGRKCANEAWKASGELLTDAIWFNLIANKAKYLLSKKKYQQFISEHSYLRPYI